MEQNEKHTKTKAPIIKLPLCIYNVKWRFLIGRRKADTEKAVLPTILFINTNHPAFTDFRRKGFMIVIGWWDFSIKFVAFF